MGERVAAGALQLPAFADGAGAEPNVGECARRAAGDGTHADKRELLVTSTLDAEPSHRYDIHADTPVPLLLALVVGFLFLAGGVYHPVFVPLACVPIAALLFVWFWSSGDRKPPGVMP